MALLMKMLQQNGIAAATLNNSDDLIENEHFQSRGTFNGWSEPLFDVASPHHPGGMERGHQIKSRRQPRPTVLKYSKAGWDK